MTTQAIQALDDQLKNLHHDVTALLEGNAARNQNEFMMLIILRRKIEETSGVMNLWREGALSGK